MAKQIDKIKKIRYKASRLKGESIKQSLINAGYTEATAEHSSSLGVVKCGEAEIMKELRAADVTVDWVVGKLNQELVNIHAKSSDRVRILELLGKYLNMFRDANPLQVSVFTGDMIKDLHPIPVDITPDNVDVSPCVPTDSKVT